jgi:hypothetical protein
MKFVNIALILGTFPAVAGFELSPKRMVKVYNYVTDTGYQRLEPDHTTETDLRERTIIFDVFTDIENWTTNKQSYSPTNDHSRFIGSITFEEDDIADGGSDGQLTLKEALTGIYTQYTIPSPYAMQSSYTIGDAIVLVTAANAKH